MPIKIYNNSASCTDWGDCIKSTAKSLITAVSTALTCQLSAAHCGWCALAASWRHTNLLLRKTPTQISQFTVARGQCHDVTSIMPSYQKGSEAISAVKVRNNGTGNKGRKELHVGGHKMHKKCVLGMEEGLKSKRKEVTYVSMFSNAGNVNT